MKKILALLALFTFLLPAFSFAADFRTDSVGKDQNVKNLYVAGQDLNIDANVASDLTAAGNVVNVNGSVENSAMIAGSTINIKGNIGKNLRVAGGTVNVDGQIGEDMIVFAGKVTISKDVTIGGDLLVYGGTVVLDGNVNGMVKGSSGDVTINGKVEKDVDFRNVGKLTVGSNAVIGGKLTYGAQNEGNIQSGSKINGGVKFNKIEKNERDFGKAMGGFFLLGLIGSFILLLVLTLLAPKSSKRIVEAAVTNPWANIGIGFVTLIVVPVALVFLLITVVGMPIAGLGFFAYILTLILSGIFSALVIGSLLYKLFMKKDVYEVSWQVILIGVIVGGLLKVVPVIGWILALGFYLLTLGSFVRIMYENILLERTAK